MYNNITQLYEILVAKGADGNSIAGDLLLLVNRTHSVAGDTPLVQAALSSIPGEKIWNGVTFKAIPAAVNALVGNSSESDNPIHQVTLRPFYMMETPVTQAQYQGVIGNNPSGFDGANNPVETVTWHDAVNYAKTLSMQAEDISNDVKTAIRNLGTEEYMRYALKHPEKELFRLPTESEWEYAARGEECGSNKNYPWGNDIREIDTYAHTSRNSQLNSIRPVGLLKANGFGLKDMIGNVWEWTADWYSSDVFNGDDTFENPTGPESGNSRVLRGGSWYNNFDRYLRSGYRNGYGPGHRDFNIGFRLVRTIK